MVENLLDGRVKIVAEGEDEKLRWFESAIDIKNALIHVSAIEKSYSPASGEFDTFGKLVAKGETDRRLDTAAGYLKDLIYAVNNMSDNLGGKMDRMLGKQDELLDEARDVNRKLDQVLEKDIVELKSDMAEVKAALREERNILMSAGLAENFDRRETSPCGLHAYL